MIFCKDLRLFADNNRQKTLKAPFYKSYIEIIIFGGACFLAKASRVSVSGFNNQNNFLFNLKMSVLQLWCLQNGLQAHTKWAFQTLPATTIDAIRR